MATATVPTERRPIGFWLKLVDRLLDEGFDRLLGDQGLTRRHWQALTALQDGPATVGELDARLAPFLGEREPSTRPVLDDLAARGWATWAAGDRAASTPGGAAAHARLLAEVSAQRRRVTEGVSADEYQGTVAVLARMAANLGWADPAATPGAERRPAQPGWPS
jgi:DNA-binding MarR family transcriptional regulator